MQGPGARFHGELYNNMEYSILLSILYFSVLCNPGMLYMLHIYICIFPWALLLPWANKNLDFSRVGLNQLSNYEIRQLKINVSFDLTIVLCRVVLTDLSFKNRIER